MPYRMDNFGRERHVTATSAPCDLTVSVAEHTGTSMTLRLDGCLDAPAAVPLVHQVRGAVSEGWTDIAIDVSAVEIPDSTGLGALVGCAKAAQGRAILRLVAVPGDLRKILDLTGLAKVFPIDDVTPA